MRLVPILRDLGFFCVFINTGARNDEFVFERRSSGEHPEAMPLSARGARGRVVPPPAGLGRRQRGLLPRRGGARADHPGPEGLEAGTRAFSPQFAESGRASGRAQLLANFFGGAVWGNYRENANCGDPPG